MPPQFVLGFWWMPQTAARKYVGTESDNQGMISFLCYLQHAQVVIPHLQSAHYVVMGLIPKECLSGYHLVAEAERSSCSSFHGTVFRRRRSQFLMIFPHLDLLKEFV